MAQRDGDYVDALVRTRSQAIPMIMETTGGLAPHSRKHVAFLAARSKGKGAVVRTHYGRTRLSTKSYYVHHMQRMTKAAVVYDALAIILKRISVLKQQRLCSGGVADAMQADAQA